MTRQGISSRDFPPDPSRREAEAHVRETVQAHDKAVDAELRRTMGARGEPLTASDKDDSSKLMIASLVLAYFPKALLSVAEVSHFGMEKYNAKPEDQGWRDVPDGERRYTDAGMRHSFKRLMGEVRNPEDGNVRHRAQVAWDALAALELEIEAEEAAVTDVFTLQEEGS